MKSLDFYNLIRDSFPFTPTLKQDIVLQNLSNFVLDKSNDKIFLLKGYAGTGKTTLIASLEKNLWKIKKSSVLLAPTGRAAKVISNYSSNEAQTIHKKIYVPRTDKNGKTSLLILCDRRLILSDNSIKILQGQMLENRLQKLAEGLNLELKRTAEIIYLK